MSNLKVNNIEKYSGSKISVNSPLEVTGSLTITGQIVGESYASDISGAFTSTSASLASRTSVLEEFSSSLDATFATDAQLSTVSSSLASRTSVLEEFSSSLDATFATDAQLSTVSSSLASSISNISGFPYTGSAKILGSLEVTGSAKISGSLELLGDGTFLYKALGPGAWSTGGALNVARRSLAGAGTQNEGLAMGGRTPSTVSCTEEYNGTSWSTGGALNVARASLAGAGTQNAGLAIGGAPTSTEEYNGTSWSTGGALSVARYNLAGAGTQDAGLAFGGEIIGPPFSSVSCTEEYNGTSWSTGGALSVARNYIAGAGTQNAGLAFGGSPAFTCTEEYNGTSWSTGGALSNGRYNLAGAGTQNAGLAFGGIDPSFVIVSCTEEYDGTSWSTGGALNVARAILAGAGTQNAGLAFGGFAVPAATPCTEEYNPTTLDTEAFSFSSQTGNTTVSCLIETSAARYKENITPLSPQLSKIMQLNPIEFDWTANKKHSIGFVAEDVKNVYPELVSQTKDGVVEGMNYSKLVSALVKSIQEQQNQIDELNNKLNNLKNS